MEAKERIDCLERDLDNMKESRDDVKDDLDELKSKFEDLEEENSNLYERTELLDCLENWREIIADRNDGRSTEIYDLL
jgi:archaellum component FlaC